MSVNNPPSPLQTSSISIDKMYASKSIDGKGSSIGKGKKVRRLQFGKDDRFSIAIKGKIWFGDRNSSPKLLGSREADQYIPLNLRNKEFVYVNVSSLSKRLGISKREIWSAFYKSDKYLQDLINNKLINLQEIIQKYQSIFDSYSHSELAKKGLIDKELLMKVVTQAIMILSDNQIESTEFTEQQTTFIALKLEEKEDQRIQILGKRYLASGGYGEVHETIFLGTVDSLVLKQTMSARLEELTKDEQEELSLAKKSLENEYRKLNHIHSKNTTGFALRGIQKRPRKFVEIKDQDKEIVSIGYLGEKYDGDLREFYKLSTVLKLKQAEDILVGLQFLYEIDIIHSDLKARNVFVKLEEGDYISDIADFGAAFDVSDNKDWMNKIIFTRKSTHPILYKMMRESQLVYKHHEGENDFGITRENAFEKFKYAGKRSDLFSTGILLYNLFTKGKDPFTYDEKDFPLVEKPIVIDAKDFDKDFPPKVIELITRILNVKDYPDLSAPKVLKLFQKAYQVYLRHLKA